MKTKNFILAIIVLLSTVFASANPHSVNEKSSRRMNKLLKFIAKNAITRDVALYALLSQRCYRYVDSAYVADCQLAVAEQIRVLDYDVHFPGDKKNSDEVWDMDSFVFIAFKKNLIDLLSSKKTSLYLDQMAQGLSDFLTGTNPQFNIWEMSQSFYLSDLQAAKVIAALFQDTSIVKLHLAYLQQTQIIGGETYKANFERLSRVIDSINLILDYSEDNYRTLFYPKSLQAKLTRNLYHFYVPLYLSMALKAEGVPSRHALVAPLMLTLTYEFITMAPDYRFIFKDPAFLDPRISTSTIYDIFSGFCGAAFGVGKNPSEKLHIYLSESFSVSTKEGVNLLLYWAK